MQLSQRFFRRNVARVAVDLLGCHLKTPSLRLRITEVEAYGGPDDSASHARFEGGPRSRTMFGPAGRAYVYLCYGLHNMFNIVAHADGLAGAVLVRAVEVVAIDGRKWTTGGAQRGGADRNGRSVGPGRVGRVLGAQVDWTGTSLYGRGPLRLYAGPRPAAVRVGPRVGIDFARPRDREAPLRFGVADPGAITRPNAMHPDPVPLGEMLAKHG